MRRGVALIAATLLVSGAGCETTKVHRLKVSRHITVSLSNARADQILADMTRVARNNDGPGDVPADVRFERDGDVTTFSIGTGIIGTRQQFEFVEGLPGHVKVVNQIKWCCGLIPDAIGCARIPGDSLVVERFNRFDLEGILWLHEFGHNKGLQHRNETGAVMHEEIAADHKRLNQHESDAIDN